MGILGISGVLWVLVGYYGYYGVLCGISIRWGDGECRGNGPVDFAYTRVHFGYCRRWSCLIHWS